MQTKVATGKYVVSFNTCFGDDEVGESRADSIDFAGDDINTLAEEVVASDPSFPMTFVRGAEGERVIGRFFGVGDDYPSALMVEKAYF